MHLQLDDGVIGGAVRKPPLQLSMNEFRKLIMRDAIFLKNLIAPS